MSIRTITEDTSNGYVTYNFSNSCIVEEMETCQTLNFNNYELNLLGNKIDKAKEYIDKKRKAEQESALQHRNERLRRMVKNIFINEDKGTIVIKWYNNEVTKVKLQEGDEWDVEKGILACMAKKLYENTGIFNEVIQEYSKKGKKSCQ